MSGPGEEDIRQSGLIRFGGLAILVALGIHIVLNGFLKEFPPEGLTEVELQQYLVREASTWAIVHGFRYIAFAGIVVFAAGLFTKTCSTRSVPTLGWGVIGLIGAAIWVTSGIVTNGIEILAFRQVEPVSEHPELFWLLFRLTRVLFTAEIAAWSITIFGFSVAGWRSSGLPKWLAGLGMLAAAAGMLSSVLVVPVLRGAGPPTMLGDVAALTSLAWFLCVGVLMVVRSEAPKKERAVGSQAAPLR